MPEIRRDPVFLRWTIVSAIRGRRLKFKDVRKQECPFCPGNEHMTPPAKLVYVKEGRKIVAYSKDEGKENRWMIRCFDNAYPLLNVKVKHRTKGSFKQIPAYGYHEIIVESPIHEDPPWSLSANMLKLVLKAARQRMTTMLADERIKYIHLFKNHGLEGGASISHPHMQIVGLPIVPPILTAESEKVSKEGCAFCDIVDKEAENPRTVANYGDIVALCPWAGRDPFELLILPVKHRSDFLKENEQVLSLVSSLINDAYKALLKLIGEFSFNMWFHTKPKDVSDFHWHVELLPRKSKWAGFEVGTGMYSITVKPEKVARELRSVMLGLKD